MYPIFSPEMGLSYSTKIGGIGIDILIPNFTFLLSIFWLGLPIFGAKNCRAHSIL